MFTDRCYVLDGGMGSTLESEGHGICDDPLWSARLLLKEPRAIVRIHEQFALAGAEMLITSSYQASLDGFHSHLGINPSDTEQLIQNSVLLAKRAGEVCTHPVLVAGSIGPYGACQADGSEYTGEHIDQLSTEDLMNWHHPRLRALMKGQPDLLAIETQPSLKEALAILKLLKEYPTAKAMLTFSCADVHRTNSGDNLLKAMEQCIAVGGDQLVAVGVNCSPPHYISPILQSLADCKKLPPPSVLPRVVYPNSGEQWVSGHGWMSSSDDKACCTDSWDIEKWMDLGAHVIGGCCRVKPINIETIAKRIQSKNATPTTA